MFDMMQIGINDITQQEYDEAVLMLNVKKMHRVFDMQLKGDRLRSVAADIVARKLISKNTGIPFENITIDEDSCGRPFFEDIYISISHSEEFAVCAISDSPVGVDIERIRPNIKKAISVGIGLFIALLGLEAAGVVIGDGATILALGDVRNNTILLSLIGIVITGILVARKVKGALFLGMIITTIIGIPMGVIELPNSIISMPPSISSTFMKFEWHNIFSFDMVIVLFTLLFMDMFDTIGTLVGVATKANMLDENGKVKNIKKALFADAIGTTVGACLGTSTVSTFVESASGVAEGGRTGLTAVSTAGMFCLALFFSPLFGMVTPAVTASALVIVGLFMIENIKEINLEDYTEAIPAFLTIIMMPFAYSIADGIAFGVLSYIGVKAFSGKVKEISIPTWIIGVVFVLKFILIH